MNISHLSHQVGFTPPISANVLLNRDDDLHIIIVLVKLQIVMTTVTKITPLHQK